MGTYMQASDLLVSTLTIGVRGPISCLGWFRNLLQFQQ